MPIRWWLAWEIKTKKKIFDYNNHPLIVINLTWTDMITVKGFHCTRNFSCILCTFFQYYPSKWESRLVCRTENKELAGKEWWASCPFNSYIILASFVFSCTYSSYCPVSVLYLPVLCDLVPTMHCMFERFGSMNYIFPNVCECCIIAESQNIFFLGHNMWKCLISIFYSIFSQSVCVRNRKGDRPRHLKDHPQPPEQRESHWFPRKTGCFTHSIPNILGFNSPAAHGNPCGNRSNDMSVSQCLFPQVDTCCLP